MGLKSKLEEIFELDDIFKNSKESSYVNARVLYYGYRYSIDKVTHSKIASEAGCTRSNVINNLRNRFDQAKKEYPMQWSMILDGFDNNTKSFKKLRDRIEILESRLSILELAEENGVLDYAMEKLELIVKAKIKTNESKKN